MNLAILGLNPALFEIIGLLGFGIYVLAYSMLTLNVVTSADVIYFTLNLVAASCVLVGLSASFNLASALIQVFWVAVSVTAIVLRMSNRRTACN